MRALFLLLLLVGGTLLLLWLVQPLLPASPLSPTRVSAWKEELAQRLPSSHASATHTPTTAPYTRTPLPLITPPPTVTPTLVPPVPPTPTPLPVFFGRLRIFVAVRGEPPPPMPAPAPEGKMYVANGDVDGSRTCHLRVFPPGTPVEGLGEGSYELWLLSGTPQEIEWYIASLEMLTAGAAERPCPRLP